MNDLLEVKNSGLQIHLDYLSFTFPLEPEEGENVYDAFVKLMPDIASVLYMDISQFGEFTDYSQNGYDYSISLGENIIIRFGGSATKMKAYMDFDNPNLRSVEKYESCNIEIKGQGCRELEFKAALKGLECDYIDIIRWYSCDLHGHTTRIDIAIDDMSGDIITLDKIFWYVKRGYYSGCFRGKPELFKTIDSDDESNGMSLYFGRSSGNHKNGIELCIYNKAAERRFNKENLTAAYWTRYEIRYRAEKADNVSYFMYKTNLQDLGVFACAELRKCLDLKVKEINGIKTDNLQVRRWDTLPAWNIFLSKINSIQLTMRPKMEMTIERKLNWRTHSLTGQGIILDLAKAYTLNNTDIWLDDSFAEVYNSICDKLKWFEEHKISQKDIEMINNYIISEKQNYLAYGEDIKNHLITKNDIDNYIKNLKLRKENFKNRFTLPF